eukprot:maker-scaffold18_size714446-snap-gene-3.30 protein:Tk08468 transcript:maker-scaffold18_size714446-snap-gene-3.30-mRNA-1 annotation:"forkhead box protein k2"
MAEIVVKGQQPQQKQQQKILVLQRDGTLRELHPAVSHDRESSEPQFFTTDEIKTEEVIIGDDGGLECVEEEITLSCHGDVIMDNADNMGEEVVIGEVEEVVGHNGIGSTEAEMSVAMDLAKMSQGHFTDNHTLNGHQFYESEEVVAAHEDFHHEEYIVANDEPLSEKPRLSYAQMIAESLLQAPERMLPLAEIYVYINKKYPYYRMDVKSWQNAIRHNLTLNPGFKKVPRPNNEGRGNYWRIEDGAEKTIFKRTIRNHYQSNRGKMHGLGEGGPMRTMSPVHEIKTSHDGSEYVDEQNRAIQTIQIIQAPKTKMSEGNGYQTITLEKSVTSNNGQVIFIALPSKS